MNCLSVFDHFIVLALKEIIKLPLFFLTEKRFGDIERFAASTLTNGLSEKTYTGAYSSPLGASYPLVKSPAKPPASVAPQTSTSNKVNGLGW